MTNIGLSITLPVIYTPRGVYAVLDAFLDADSDDKKHLCICLQHSPLSPVVFWRSESVWRPLEMDTKGLGSLRRYKLMVQSRKNDTTVAPVYRSNAKENIGLILVLKETATQFFDAQPESSTSCFHSSQSLVPKLEGCFTWPSELYDYRNGLVSVSPPQLPNAVDPLHTVLLHIETNSQGRRGRTETYYLFFAAILGAGTVTWYCDMTTNTQLTKLRLTHLIASRNAMYEHFRDKAMTELGSERQRMRTASDGLQVDIGSSVYLFPDMVTRTAILSGPSPGGDTRRRRHEAVWESVSGLRLPAGVSRTPAKD
ncbi:HET-domain-containing protein [Apiospora sp. TS-2023a]